MAINLRSPYYTSTSVASTAYATLDISIWNGDKNTPLTAQYSLRKNVIGTSVDVLFEISELVRDYVDVYFDGDYNGQAVWVKTVKTAYNSSNTPLQVFTNTQSAFDGYSYFEEPNLSPNNNSVFISNRELFVLEDNVFRIPIHTANSPSVVFYKDGEVIASETFNTEDLSANQIKYVSIYGDDVNWDTFQERVLNENGSYEDSSCLQSFFNSYSIGAVDKITVSADYYGDELVVNGDFETNSDWSILAGDTIANGKLNISGQGARVSDTFLPIVGKNYLLTFDITDYTSGDIRAFNGGSGVDLLGALTANGSYSVNYLQTETVANNLNFYVPTSFEGSISNVSVVESFGVITDTIKVNVIEECKYEPKKVTFINKFGALQDMYFFKKAVEQMTIKKESYKSNIISSLGTYNSYNHVNRDFNVVGSESITLSSGYLSEEYNEVFKQLLLSEKVWVTNILETGEQVLPINVKTSSIKYKTSLNDKLVDYTIEFDKSFDTINNIR
tara:strand:+ start:12 stop:1517 length:1506 start_codon:yes stop_codon:yes gene_type:complete